MQKYLVIKEEVKEALEKGIGVVALESTIISHGMPYPKNLEVAKTCEDIIRKEGCVPATIAIIDGIIHVGLTDVELMRIAKGEEEVIKCSRRDLPIVLAKKQNGATTVAATMFIASLAGIKVFATGGIGGVHRGVEKTWDISCDLEELAKTNVAVVCAGIKAILDLDKTLEYLETKGVSVLGYKTNMLPAFYSKESNLKVDACINSPEEIADILKIKWGLGEAGGVLITNPIPDEYSLPKEEIDQTIEQALKEMDEKGIKGKEQTPFLLAKVVELTKGASLDANVALVYNNCHLASKIAKAL